MPIGNLTLGHSKNCPCRESLFRNYVSGSSEKACGNLLGHWKAKPVDVGRKNSTDITTTPKGPETLGIFFIPVSSWVSEALIWSHFTVERTKPGKSNICQAAVLKPEQESSSPEPHSKTLSSPDYGAFYMTPYITVLGGVFRPWLLFLKKYHREPPLECWGGETPQSWNVSAQKGQLISQFYPAL